MEDPLAGGNWPRRAAYLRHALVVWWPGYQLVFAISGRFMECTGFHLNVNEWNWHPTLFFRVASGNGSGDRVSLDNWIYHSVLINLVRFSILTTTKHAHSNDLLASPISGRESPLSERDVNSSTALVVSDRACFSSLNSRLLWVRGHSQTQARTWVNHFSTAVDKIYGHSRRQA